MPAVFLKEILNIADLALHPSILGLQCLISRLEFCQLSLELPKSASLSHDALAHVSDIVSAAESYGLNDSVAGRTLRLPVYFRAK